MRPCHAIFSSLPLRPVRLRDTVVGLRLRARAQRDTRRHELELVVEQHNRQHDEQQLEQHDDEQHELVEQHDDEQHHHEQRRDGRRRRRVDLVEQRRGRLAARRRGRVDAGDASTPVVCNTTVTKYAVDPSPHIPVCFPVQYSTNPPTSGPHYPIWAAFKTYTTPVPRGFYVHDLEHGAVVITYNCPEGCDAELSQLQAWLDARPADPICVAPVKSRVVVTPDPKLDVRFAASAWGWSLRSQCFDLQWLGLFMDAHYGQGPEVLCANGSDVTDPDAGIPSSCGEPDAGP
jgi:hypothetical protein